jgi:hypothetical protein
MTRRLLPQILDGVDADDCADTPETWTKLVSDRIRKRLPITRRVLASMFNAAFITAMVVIAAMGCAAAQQRPMTTPAAPDTDAILRLVGRFGSAHASRTFARSILGIRCTRSCGRTGSATTGTSCR